MIYSPLVNCAQGAGLRPFLWVVASAGINVDSHIHQRSHGSLVCDLRTGQQQIQLRLRLIEELGSVTADTLN